MWDLKHTPLTSRIEHLGYAVCKTGHPWVAREHVLDRLLHHLIFCAYRKYVLCIIWNVVMQKTLLILINTSIRLLNIIKEGKGKERINTLFGFGLYTILCIVWYDVIQKTILDCTDSCTALLITEVNKPLIIKEYGNQS